MQKGKKKKVWKPPQQAHPEPKMDIQIMSNRLSGRNAPPARGGRKIVRGKKPEPIEAVEPRAPSPVADDAAKQEVVAEERFEVGGERGHRKSRLLDPRPHHRDCRIHIKRAYVPSQHNLCTRKPV